MFSGSLLYDGRTPCLIDGIQVEMRVRIHQQPPLLTSGGIDISRAKGSTVNVESQSREKRSNDSQSGWASQREQFALIASTMISY